MIVRPKDFCKVVHGISAVSLSAGGSTDFGASGGIDVSDWEYALIIVNTGVTDTVLTVQAQEGPTSTISGHSDITGATMTIAATDDATSQAIDLRLTGKDAFLNVDIDAVGGTSAVVSCTVVLFRPIDQQYDIASTDEPQTSVD